MILTFYSKDNPLLRRASPGRGLGALTYETKLIPALRSAATPSFKYAWWSSYLGILFLVLLGGLLCTACGPPGADVVPTFAPPPTPGLPPSATYTVSTGNVAESISARGRIVAQQEATLAFPIGGTLKAVHVSPGDRVSEGDLLAELDAPGAQKAALLAQFDLEQAERALQLKVLQTEQVSPSDLEARLLAAEIGVERARVELAYAQTAYEQALSRHWAPIEETEAHSWTLRLNQWNYQLAQAQLTQVQQEQRAEWKNQELQAEAQELELAIARTQVERARLQRDWATAQLSDTLLAAPLTGVAVSIEKRAGDQVGAYETIGVVADPSQLWIIATILEENVDRIHVGQAATIRLDVYPNQTYSGTVLQIVDQAALWQGSEAYEVTIAFDEGQVVPATIRMGADVSITGRSKGDVLLVPSDAILTIGERQYVELINEDGEGEVERVEIETGLANDEWTEVTAGLREGQVIRIP